MVVRFSEMYIMVVIAGGGEMISDVFLDHSTYADPPSRLGGW